MTFAKIRQNKKFILGGLIKKWCGWEWNGFKWRGTGWKTHNWVNLMNSCSTVSFYWVMIDNMSVGIHQICSLLIMMGYFKIISYCVEQFYCYLERGMESLWPV
jgi:hypothetical protein